MAALIFLLLSLVASLFKSKRRICSFRPSGYEPHEATRWLDTATAGAIERGAEPSRGSLAVAGLLIEGRTPRLLGATNFWRHLRGSRYVLIR